MAIGGWSWSGQFSGLAETAAGRQKFVQSCVDQYIRGDLPGLPAGAAAGIFDGIFVDWEYPGAPGNNNPYGPQDTPDYTALMQEFRGELDAQSRQTGRALPADRGRVREPRDGGEHPASHGREVRWTGST